MPIFRLILALTGQTGILAAGACTITSDQGGNVSADNFMPELVLQYDMGEDTMVYAKFSDSAKSGGAGTGSSIPDGQVVYDGRNGQRLRVRV